jgi:CO/xanthine dehydrogenase Mo-binding subunit
LGLPTAADIPPIDVAHLDGELIGEFDLRAVGEGGTVAGPPAVLNAVADALGGQPAGAAKSCRSRRRGCSS